MGIRNIKLVLAYDGTDFCGWQIQRRQRSIQGELTRALETMHRHPMQAAAAGRTDAGVHAKGQVVTFATDLKAIPDWKFREALKFYLPRDIRVLESAEAAADFHARFSAVQRVYRYYIYISPAFLPWLSRYAARRSHYPDLAVLNRMAAQLYGEQDFSTFAAAGDKSTSKKRRVCAACFYIEGQYLVFKIAADGFLYKMVRSLVGTMLGLHDAGGTHLDFKALIEGRKRALAGVTAPANGLFLEKVYYGNEPDYLA